MKKFILALIAALVVTSATAATFDPPNDTDGRRVAWAG